MAMEAKMHEFLHQQNLIRYRKLLTETTSEVQRHQLLKLLAEEEAYEQKPARQKFTPDLLLLARPVAA